MFSKRSECHVSRTSSDINVVPEVDCEATLAKQPSKAKKLRGLGAES